MIYEIEHGIPVPPKRHPKYPLVDLEIGDSFFVPTTDVKNMRRVAAAMSMATRRIPNHPRFTMRVLKDGMRVWRIK